ncbi:MAG: DUF2085 domain-containing protein [Euryarchaeota archaeon]|nr:DUF2085 domain-containing protein [Euryarchaeota archaeon]
MNKTADKKRPLLKNNPNKKQKQGFSFIKKMLVIKRRESKFSKVILVLFLFFACWVFLQVAAPFALPTGSVQDLSGVVAYSDNDQIISTMNFPWNVIYTLGDRLCHQQAERSFFLNGNQMPFCVRCTAIWLGFAIGLGFMVFFSLELNEKFLFVLLISLVPIGIDGVGQLFGLWESTNIIRMITGILAGFVCGIAIGIIRDEVISTQFFANVNIFHKNKS